ncbi:unnamed protein product [Clavelina lepadiformis]|uniref:WW domain-containing protein n=1 Tax=Clavelina lepadiformis TaxID=159417 RepID=A0ABP0F1A1_CLALP
MHRNTGGYGYYGSGSGAKPVQAPLPAGWEAKYDPQSRKWFYINHATKTTQWVDPRLGLQQTPTSSTKFIQSSPAVKRAPETTSFIDADPAKIKTIKSKYNINDELVRSLLRTHNNNVDKVEASLKEMGYKLKVEPSPNMVSLLKLQYPTAAEFTIRDQLIQTNNNVQAARLNLQALGYKRGDGSSKSSATTSNVPKTTPVKKTTPQKVKQKKTASQISEEKRKAKITLKKAFPNVDDTTLDLCLSVSDNNVELAKGILKKKQEDDKKKKTTARISREVSTPSPSKPTEVSTASFEPVVFGDEPSTSVEVIPSKAYAFILKRRYPDAFEYEINDQLLATKNDLEKASEAMERLGYKKEEKTKPSPSNTSTSTINLKQTAQTRLKTQYQKAKTTKTVKVLNNAYKSALRMEPVGPNTGLCKGPDPTMLLQTYVEKLGPNRANRMGPQRSNRGGPQRENHSGPARIAVGPSGYAIMI